MIYRAAISMAALCTLAACGGDAPDPFGPDALPTPAAPYDPASATARITGRVVFEGAPPETPVLNMASDFFCNRNARGTRDNAVLVTGDGLLRDVIVYVRSGHDASLEYAPPEEPVLLDQILCVYVPRALTIMTGQPLLVRNSDATFHNVHSRTVVNTPFNFGQPTEGQENIQTFSEPEMPVTIGCDLHRWMLTSIGVFDHPFHATSGDTGTFELALPPGTYEIVAWHERYGERTAMMEVGANQAIDLDFTFADTDG